MILTHVVAVKGNRSVAYEEDNEESFAGLFSNIDDDDGDDEEKRHGNEGERGGGEVSDDDDADGRYEEIAEEQE